MFKLLSAFVLIFMMNVHAADTKKYSQEELNQMLAPIALYPDALLSQILMATTYDSQLKEAIGYSKANPNEKGDEAVKKVQDKGWDASVASLVAFPQVLEMLGKKPEWSKDLGDAFLAQPDSMMDAIQILRKKAKDAGNLKTSKEQTVKVEDKNSTQAIVIVPATQTVYVPVYNPAYVYGVWMYPAYPPYYYYPPHYNPAPGFIFGFTFGIIVRNSMWGGFGWHNHSVNINVNHYNKVNVNKINVNSNNVNWKNHTQRSANKRPANKQARSAKDMQRDKARQAMGNKGLNLSRERKNLSGSSGDKMRNNLNSGKFKSPSQSNAFSGVNRPSRSNLEANRGSFSRESSGRSFKSHGGFSGGGSKHGSFGGGGHRGRR